MSKTKRLYANNAKTTIAVAIGVSDTSITVSDGSAFPTPSAAGDYFLATLEAGSSVEIVRVTARVGNVFTCIRAQEGTTAATFPIGARVENRVTKETLESFVRTLDRLDDAGSVESLTSPATSDSNSYLLTTLDDGGNPIVAFKAGTTWRLNTHKTPVVQAGVISSRTNVGLSSLAITAGKIDLTPVANRYILQFTSGSLIGQFRIITASSVGSVVWGTPLATFPAVSDTFDVYKSDYGVMQDLLSRIGDGLIYAITLGE